ncbi:MAG: YkgJ family cysteine cluster protein [bacterium]|nr:YkgJ family cysteine cluster protein [bacterium]
MNVIENARPRTADETIGADTPITPQEKFVNSVYASLDSAIARELDRLRRGDGVIPACTRGCSHCCRHHIVTNVAEAHALAQYVRREFSTGRIRSLRIRTKRWHEWNDYRPGSRPPADISGRTDFSRYDHCCPLLVGGACSAYPVRPVVCRTHYVRSHPDSCRVTNDPKIGPHPTAITSIADAGNRYSATIREYIERAGWDYSRSVMLLPHWLAIQMGWDFAVKP